VTGAVSTAVLGVTMILAGLAFGPTPLLVPGIGFAVLGSLSAAWVGLAARGGLERRFETTRLVEGEPCALRLLARTPVAPPPGSELVEPLLADGPRPTVRWNRREQELNADVRFARRGRVEAEPARFIVRDPLGLASRELGSAAEEVLVLPRVEAVRALRRSRARAGAVEAEAGAAPDGAEIEVDSLREAPPGAPATRIHWPAYARTGTLIERTLTSETDRRALVVLDASSPSSVEALDSAVRAAASLCVWLARAGGCELLLPGERRPATVDAGLANWPALHARLAFVEAGGRPAAIERLGRATVFWATARAGGRPPRSLLRAGAGERYLVVPGPAPADAAFEVGGCYGRRLAQGSARRAA
jgi:uncharacterized protein (DUF58 family)